MAHTALLFSPTEKIKRRFKYLEEQASVCLLKKLSLRRGQLDLQHTKQWKRGCSRGPAPKERPMISGSKIESADFYLTSRGYRILFKNEFLLFQFHFKSKISSRKLFPSDSSKIRPKISSRKKQFRNHYRNAK